MKKGFKLILLETLICRGGENRRNVELFGRGIEGV